MHAPGQRDRPSPPPGLAGVVEGGAEQLQPPHLLQPAPQRLHLTLHQLAARGCPRTGTELAGLVATGKAAS